MPQADLIDPQRVEHYRTVFHIFGRDEAPGLDSPMYAELSYGVSLDDDLLAVAAQKRKGQPAPNVFFAAVQYLLLSGVDHPLAAHYPIVSGAERPQTPAFPLFRDFVLTHREAVLNLVRTRSTQTNVVRRCACLLPAFSIIATEADAPLALIDLGASGGVNLNFDRYGYCYLRAGAEERRWGSPTAAVQLESDLRGPGVFPDLLDDIPVASRVGVDLNPINLRDAEQLRWLQALIWPEHIERHARLIAAAAELDASPVELHRGDGAELLHELIRAAPPDSALVVYATVALYQFGRGRIAQIQQTLREAAQHRPIWLLTLEGREPQLSLTRYAHGDAIRQMLANASPHGWWMEWAAPASPAAPP